MARSNGTGTQAVASVRCAIYTRKSTEEGLDQDFNSLDAQREAGEAYIRSQASEGWTQVPGRYDDGGFTGANMERPAMKRLLADIEAKRVDCVVVYKVDRLSRSIRDFAKIMEAFEKYGATFVSVTQQFNTTTSLGRLTLNILLSFAQFEREIISERTRDKQAAARKKGKWTGGHLMLGYDLVDGRLVVNETEAERVRQIFEWYLEGETVFSIVAKCERLGWRAKQWTTLDGKPYGGYALRKCHVYKLLANPVCAGKMRSDGELYSSEHPAIIDARTFELTQEKLKENTRNHGTREPGRKIHSLLRGLIYCSACGSAMTPSYSSRKLSRYRYYVCVRKHDGTRCVTRSVSAPSVEDAVVESVRRFATTPEMIEEVARAARERMSKDLNRLREDLKATNASTRNTKSQMARATRLDPERVSELRKLIESGDAEAERGRIAITRAERVHLNEATVRQKLEPFDQIWATMTGEQQCAFLRQLVERVGYDSASDKVKVTFKSHGIREFCRIGAKG